MSRYAAIVNGVAQSPRPYAERDEGSIHIPDHVMRGDTTPDNGTTWFRNGVELEDPGHAIPVADVLKRMTDQELATWLTAAFPGCSTPLAGALVRVLAQTELHSKDPRVIAALPGFTAMFGAERVEQLLAP